MDSNIPFIGDAETCRLKQKLNAAHQSLVYQAEQLHDVRCTLACMESILAQVPPGHGDLEFLASAPIYGTQTPNSTLSNF